MKKKIFRLTILLAMIFAISGYSYTINDENAVAQSAQSSDELAVDSGCKTCDSYDDSCDSCGPCDDPCETCEPSCEPCKEVPKTGQPTECAYNAPARIDPACGMKAWVNASFLWWLPKEKGLDLGKHVTRDKTNQIFNLDVIKQDFDYYPSFRVGAGLSFCRDDWTLYLEYTRLNCDDSKSEDLGTTGNFDTNYLDSYWFYLLTSGNFRFKSLKSKWDLDYNVLDLELGRPYYVGKKVVFKPHFGIRGGWLDQRYHLDGVYSTATSAGGGGPFTGFNFVNVTLRGKSDSWFIGPRAGLDSDWFFGCDFRIFANLAGSLTYQDYKASVFINRDLQTGGAAASHNLKKSDNYLMPNVEFATGLGYGRYFCNNVWYFDFNVGYDFHYFWNQNKITNLEDRQQISSAWETDEGSLVIHGLTVTARLDF